MECKSTQTTYPAIQNLSEIPLPGSEQNEVLAENVLYFNSLRNYTIGLLNIFNDVKYYVHNRTYTISCDQDVTVSTDKEIQVPIKFGSYEKSINLKDLNKKDFEQISNSTNILPRMILSFDSMNRNTERQTNKYNKIRPNVKTPLQLCKELKNDMYIECVPKDERKNVQYILNGLCTKRDNIIFSYNSIPYDFSFTLLIQTRGFSAASQLTETILSRFNPSMSLSLFEFPLFDEKTTTQIIAGDPQFDIMGFEKEEVNIVNVSIPLTVRGNIYSPIKVSSKVKTLRMILNVWDEYNYSTSKLATQFDFDSDGVLLSQRTRHYDGTIPPDNTIYKDEQYVEEHREDYYPNQSYIRFWEGDNFEDVKI